MRWWRWGLALMPVVVGVAVAALVVYVPELENPVFYAYVDVATLALIGGVALSVLAAAGLVLRERGERRCRRRVVGIRAQVADERRRSRRLLRLVHRYPHRLPWAPESDRKAPWPQ